MSIIGIDKVKNSSTIFVGVENRGMVSRFSSNNVYLNTVFSLNSTYNNSASANIKNSADIKNTEMSLTNPSSNFVNLSFAFINVADSLQSQIANNISSNSVFLNVDNSLTYTHTLNKVSSNSRDNIQTTVLSTNSEYEITLSLDGTSLPDVNVFYPNVSERVEIELDENTVWA